MEREHWYIAAAGILSGLIVFSGAAFARLGLSLYQIIVLPMLFTVLILLPFVILRRDLRLTAGMLKFYIPFGFIAFVTAFLEFAPIFFGVPVAIIAILLYTQPIWTAIFSRIFLKEKVTRLKSLAIFIAVLGVVVLINPFAAQDVSSLAGIIIALGGGVALSGWVICGRLAGTRKYNPVTTNFGYTLVALIFLLAFYPLFSLIVQDRAISGLGFSLPGNIWTLVLLFTVFASILPHVLYFSGAKKVRASSAGIILLLEPVTGAVLASLFLSQAITWNVLAGGALVLASNYLVFRE